MKSKAIAVLCALAAVFFLVCFVLDISGDGPYVVSKSFDICLDALLVIGYSWLFFNKLKTIKKNNDENRSH